MGLLRAIETHWKVGDYINTKWKDISAFYISEFCDRSFYDVPSSSINTKYHLITGDYFSLFSI